MNAQLVMHDAYLDYTRRFFARWAPVYDLFGAAVGPAYNAAIERIRPVPGRRVLDLCAGTGAIAARCARRGAEVVAADVSRAMLTRARAKLRPTARVTLADARTLPFRDDCFDVTVLSFALHDMPRRVRLAVLREATRVTCERLVIVDYDFSRLGRFRNPLVRIVSLFETAYFPRFAASGIESLLPEVRLASAGVVRPWPFLCAVHDVPLRSGA